MNTEWEFLELLISGNTNFGDPDFAIWRPFLSACRHKRLYFESAIYIEYFWKSPVRFLCYSDANDLCFTYRACIAQSRKCPRLTRAIVQLGTEIRDGRGRFVYLGTPIFCNSPTQIWETCQASGRVVERRSQILGRTATVRPVQRSVKGTLAFDCADGP